MSLGYAECKAPHFPIKERRATLKLFNRLFNSNEPLVIYVNQYRVDSYVVERDDDEIMPLLSLYSSDIEDIEKGIINTYQWLFSKENWRKAKVHSNTVRIKELDGDEVVFQIYKEVPVEL